MSKISCEVIKDLLPSYVDGIVSDDSKRLVEEHLGHCEDCERVRREMAGEEPRLQEEDEQQREIEYLKKIKRRHKIIIASSIGGFCALAAVCIWSLYIFYGGVYVLSNLDYHVAVDGKSIEIRTEIPDEFSYRDCTYKQVGETVNVNFECRPDNPIQKRVDKVTLTHEAEGDVKTVIINGCVLWQDGVEIDEDIAEAYEAKNAYVGDASADIAVAEKIGVYGAVGDFTSELETKKEPYGWILNISELHDNNAEIAAQKMKKYAFKLLALIGNLDHVTWNYRVENETKTLTISQADASAEMGRDIKEYGSSAKLLQELFKELAY